MKLLNMQFSQFSRHLIPLKAMLNLELIKIIQG
jgi:hypothetical protein